VLIQKKEIAPSASFRAKHNPGPLQVFKCIVSGVEFFSDAKAFTDVMDEEG